MYVATSRRLVSTSLAERTRGGTWVGGSRPMVGKKKDTDTAVNFVNPLTVGDTDGDSDGSVDEGQTSFRECAPRAACCCG